MKIGLILFAVIQSLWSIEWSLGTLYFIVGLNLFWLFITGIGLAIFSLSLNCFFVEGMYRFLARWSYINDWLKKRQSKNDPWIARCYRYRYWGLFFGGFVPAIGIPMQKIFQFRYGYLALFGGNIAKVPMIVMVIKIFENLI